MTTDSPLADAPLSPEIAHALAVTRRGV
ncbi:MAG: hypothetical protein RLZ34_223, partial [Pseudomonadota bacterium]